MTIERDADRVVSCFALEQELHRRGFEHVFGGEVSGLISAGAFVAFAAEGLDGATDRVPPYEGMLPVRLLRAPSSRPSRPAPGRGRPGRPSRQPRADAGEREWWELNEQDTILRGERTGATIRLGQRLPVRVARVDTVRGRVDLEPAA